MKTGVLFQYKYALLWALFILFACGAQPSTLTKLRLEDLFGYDKPIHAFLFGAQAWLLVKGYQKKYITYKLHKRIGQFCIAAAAYGILIEALQKWFFTGRTYDYFDMLANSLGCLIMYIYLIKKHTHV